MFCNDVKNNFIIIVEKVNLLKYKKYLNNKKKKINKLN